MRILFLYDDREATPSLIRQIIGVERFSSIVRRKRRLGDTLEALATQVDDVDFMVLGDAQVRAHERELLERLPSDTMIFRLPSAIMPLDTELFERLLRKLPYSLGPALFGDILDDEAVTLLPRTEALTLLGISDARDRRSFLATFADHAVRIDDICHFTDLRTVNSFLGFMTGATEARHFNAISASGGVFRKSSTDCDKMQREYSFFHVVPERMKRFLVPTFDYIEADGRASYGMEKLAIPDAALQLVHHSFSPASFDKLLDAFFDFVVTREKVATGPQAIRSAAATETLAKVERRRAELMGTSVGQSLDHLLQAAGPLGDVANLLDRARLLVEAAIERDRTSSLVVSHGDPCFSNILFNRDLGLFRLIDPRGALVLQESYMHPAYDLAKFSHSVLGNYDFINNGLFEVKLGADNRFVLELDGGGTPAWMREAFRDRLRVAGYDLFVIRAFELTLFLSMLPLHIDVPRKLPAFCIVAGAIISELEAMR